MQKHRFIFFLALLIVPNGCTETEGEHLIEDVALDVTQDQDTDSSTSTDGTHSQCPLPQASLPNPVGPLPEAASPHRGIDAYEANAFETFMNAALEDPEIHFVTTFEHESSLYHIYSGDSTPPLSPDFFAG